MSESASQATTSRQLEAITNALTSGTFQQARRLLSALHPAEIGLLLESTPSPERELIFELVSPDDEGEVLLHVNDEVRAGLINAMDQEQLVAATQNLDMDDLADIISDLPRAVIGQVLRAMDQQERARLEAVLAYPEDSAGGLMNTDTVTVRPDVSIDVVLRYLRVRGKLPELTDALIIVDRYGHYVGMLPIAELFIGDPEATVADVMITDAEPIPVATPSQQVAKIFEDRDLISAPVVNETGVVVGRITIDDVVDVIREEAEHSLLSMAGLDEEEDMFAPVITSFQRRSVWLGANLLTAFAASAVVGLYQPTIEKVVALAVLMPVVASMGGIAGSQTLTLMIRGLALGQLGRSNTGKLMSKELALGLLNGVAWALVVSVIALLWFGSASLGLVIAMALIANLLVAALSGVLIPLILKRFGVDPALAGHVILTTVTDVVGFFIFLGLGSVLLL
ncbi:MAG: magnesium transporter [Pseudomonadota bacterium]|nr:magnesium transporter [Pseudomonadota bacterium]